jgi:hypothetical protein
MRDLVRVVGKGHNMTSHTVSKVYQSALRKESCDVINDTSEILEGGEWVTDFLQGREGYLSTPICESRRFDVRGLTPAGVCSSPIERDRRNVVLCLRLEPIRRERRTLVPMKVPLTKNRR